MYLSVLSEVLHDGRICMEPIAYQNLRRLIFSNIEMRVKAEDIEKKHAEQQVLSKGREGMCSSYIFPSDAYRPADRREFYGSLAADDDVVNVITIAGPMTRGGGACSYGSIDHRDLIVEAANVPQVRAHILVTRTPGGMASTLRDYRMAINYAHAHGQKVYMLCDGDVASGGAFTATICDAIYAVNPDDNIGSLGMYCAFFTSKEGDKDAVTQETYHEYYASASKDKNAWYRAAAEGDMSLVEKEVNADLQQLLANVKADRPQVKAEQLTGKMYRMGDVEGSLIDGFTSLSKLAVMAINEWHERKGAELPAKEGGKSNANDDDNANNNQNTNTNQKQENMKTYPNLGKAAGLEVAFEQQADGYVSLTEEQADVLETAIVDATTANEETAQALADAQTQVAELTEQSATKDTEIESLKQQLAEAQTKADELQASLTSKEEELANAQAAAETASAEAQTAHEQAIAELQGKLDEANATVASKEATINDLNATIESLNASAGGRQNGGGAPENNGAGTQQPTYSMEGMYDHSLSPAENRKRIEAYEKKQREIIARG